MLNELVPGKVYYKIFDRNFTESTGKYSLLRCRNDAEIKQVQENRRAIIRHSGADSLGLLQQVHGSKVASYQLGFQTAPEPIADGAVTNIPGFALGVLTADCCPILLYCSKGRAVGAVHAGWRGALAGIIENAIIAMQQAGAGSLSALIGPTIAQDSYEVDDVFKAQFIGSSPAYDAFFKPGKDASHYYFDLPSFVTSKLKLGGVEQITDMEHNTYSMHQQYPSYRRSCHDGTKYNQNILSLIMIKP